MSHRQRCRHPKSHLDLQFTLYERHGQLVFASTGIPIDDTAGWAAPPDDAG